ncbi:FAD-dependent oxidoreductase [Dactylosporangium sp. CA-092794]|uniref:NAD(P)/FAD-dependent oxidoreductase n=1 Tax=Dactylosporangium sp. CA-092794 TaxID=3239929 RepID=UPI003D8C1A39
MGHRVTVWDDRLSAGELAALAPGRPEDLDRTPDVLIVGGGAIGLSAAVFCLRAGLGRVVLIERAERLAPGASSGNGGAIAPDMHLLTDGPEFVAFGRRSLELYRELDAEWGGAIGTWETRWLDIRPASTVPFGPQPASASSAAPLPGQSLSGTPLSRRPLRDGPPSDGPLLGGPLAGPRFPDGPLADRPLPGGPRAEPPFPDGPLAGPPFSDRPLPRGSSPDGPPSRRSLPEEPSPDELLRDRPPSEASRPPGPVPDGSHFDDPQPDRSQADGPRFDGPQRGGLWLLDAAAVRELEPDVVPPDGAIAVLAERQLAVNPLRLAAALAPRAGQVATGVAMLGVTMRGDRVAAVHTNVGDFSPGALILATGLVPAPWDVGVPQRWVKGHMLAVAPGPWRLGSVLAGPFGGGSPLPDGTIVCGGTFDEGDQTLDVYPEIADPMAAALATILPAAAGATISRRWCCFRPYIEGRQPVIDRLPGVSNGWFAGGHFTTGIMMAPATGAALAAWIGSGTAPPPVRSFTLPR